MAKKIRIGFIGAGNMARAMIKGLCCCSLYSISASDPDKKILSRICRDYRVKKIKTNSELALKADIIIIAVKPQVIEKALVPLKNVLAKKHLVVSIAAGVSIGKIQKLLGAGVPVVRVMPNTPALVGEGACGYAVSREVSAARAALAEKILRAFCRVAIRLPESKINTVTALSGSGPAYFFYFAEAMISAAKDAGLDAKTAGLLAAQTMTGSGKMIIETGEEPRLLRKRVTSKGGTTEAAIRFMEKKKTGRIIKAAVMKAKKRADALGR